MANLVCGRPSFNGCQVWYQDESVAADVFGKRAYLSWGVRRRLVGGGLMIINHGDVCEGVLLHLRCRCRAMPGRRYSLNSHSRQPPQENAASQKNSIKRPADRNESGCDMMAIYFWQSWTFLLKFHVEEFLMKLTIGSVIFLKSTYEFKLIN